MPAPHTAVTAVVPCPWTLARTGIDCVDQLPSRLTCTVIERMPRLPRGVVAHLY
jgi:hypothetical protein